MGRTYSKVYEGMVRRNSRKKAMKRLYKKDTAELLKEVDTLIAELAK